MIACNAALAAFVTLRRKLVDICRETHYLWPPLLGWHSTQQALGLHFTAPAVSWQ